MQTYNGCLSRAPVEKVFWSRTWRINDEKRQNRIQDERIRGEHPAGRSMFWIKRANNYDCTDQAGLPVWLRTEYRTVRPTPGTRLADWVEYPRQNNKRSFWMNRRTQTVLPRLPTFFVSSFVYFRLDSDFMRNLSGKNGFRYKCSEKCVCRIIFSN